MHWRCVCVRTDNGWALASCAWRVQTLVKSDTFGGGLCFVYRQRRQRAAKHVAGPKVSLFTGVCTRQAQLASAQPLSVRTHTVVVVGTHYEHVLVTESDIVQLLFDVRLPTTTAGNCKATPQCSKTLALYRVCTHQAQAASAQPLSVRTRWFPTY